MRSQVLLKSFLSFMFNFLEDIIYLLARVAPKDKACFGISKVLLKNTFEECIPKSQRGFPLI